MPSFRELSAWISALIILGFYGSFLAGIAQHTDPDATLGALAGIVVAIIVVEIVLMVALAIFTRRGDQIADERDRLIAAKAYRNAYFIVASGIFFAIVYSLVPDLARLVEALNLPPATILAHMLVISLVSAELVNYASRILYYRSGV
jgi:hypothetical protein